MYTVLWSVYPDGTPSRAGVLLLLHCMQPLPEETLQELTCPACCCDVCAQIAEHQNSALAVISQ
jgi:hypothetical protein